jgi:hypothetical protein
MRLQVLLDALIAASVSGAAFIFDAKAGVSLYLISAGLFAGIGAIAAIFQARSFRDLESVAGAEQLPSGAKILSDREVRWRTVRRTLIWAVFAALATLLLGMQGPGIVTGAAIGAFCSTLVWHRAAAGSDKEWYSPVGWTFWRRTRGPWVYYKPQPGRAQDAATT